MVVLKQLINEWAAFIQDQLFVERNQMMLLRPQVFITICCIFLALTIRCFCMGNRCKYCILHFNGSDINQHNKGGAGCIIRNKQGDLVIAGAYNLDDLNECPKQFHVAIAGAVALRNGLKLAKQNNVKLHLIKGKNEEVINRVLDRHKRSPEHPLLSKLITEIKKALKEQSIDPKTQVMLIGEGEANEVAHELANYGSNILEFGNEEIYSREDDLPPKVTQLLQQDKNIWRTENFRM